MEHLIDQTLHLAKKKFSAFGFSQSQIDLLLASAQSDLNEVLCRLQSLLEDETSSPTQLKRTLHDLKGLLYNMGHTQAGDLIAKLENEHSKEKIKSKLNTLS